MLLRFNFESADSYILKKNLYQNYTYYMESKTHETTARGLLYVIGNENFCSVS